MLSKLILIVSSWFHPQPVPVKSPAVHTPKPPIVEIKIDERPSSPVCVYPLALAESEVKR